MTARAKGGRDQVGRCTLFIFNALVSQLHKELYFQHLNANQLLLIGAGSFFPGPPCARLPGEIKCYPADSNPLNGLTMNYKIDQTNRFLPVWVWVVVLIQIFLVLFFSAGTAMSPAEFIPDVSELNYVTQLYVTRNITIAIGIILALFLRSHKALLVTLIVRLLTDVSDVVSVYALDVEVIKSSVPMVVVLLILPALAAAGYLWKRMNS